VLSCVNSATDLLKSVILGNVRFSFARKSAEGRDCQFARGGSSHWPASAPDGNEGQVPERS
jgi:hypothetical protein